MPELLISAEKVGFLIEKAREFDVKEGDSDPDSGSNGADDGMTDVLEDNGGDPVVREITGFINALTEDEQIDLVALMRLGRCDGSIEEWNELRREAAEHRRSMEEEARQALTARFRKRLSPEELVKRLKEINAEHPPRSGAKMLASEFLIASRRLESLFESELISRDEKISWDDKINRDAVSLSEVEQFAAGRRNWRTEKS